MIRKKISKIAALSLAGVFSFAACANEKNQTLPSSCDGNISDFSLDSLTFTPIEFFSWNIEWQFNITNNGPDRSLGRIFFEAFDVSGDTPVLVLQKHRDTPVLNGQTVFRVGFITLPLNRSYMGKITYDCDPNLANNSTAPFFYEGDTRIFKDSFESSPTQVVLEKISQENPNSQIIERDLGNGEYEFDVLPRPQKAPKLHR